MSTRWKPNLGDRYWFAFEFCKASSAIWGNHATDRLYFDSGNCFKTKEQTDAAIEKIKKVLMEVHDE